jgi:AcrR family transcriptional regulator
MSDGSTSEPPRPAPRHDRSARVSAETKLRYLAAAAELAMRTSPGEDTFPYAVSRVTMADVAADLGIARTTLYKLWPSKLAFWADLTTYIATAAIDPTADDVATSILQPPTEAPRVTMDRARVELNALQERQRVNPWLALRTALLGYAGDEQVDALVAAANARDIDEIVTQVDRILAELGVTPREPLTAHDIAVLGFSVADGLATGGRLSPRINAHDLALDGEPPGWGMLALALRAIVRRCTRPRTEADAERSSTAPTQRPPAIAPSARWSAAQLAALTAGARRFTTGAPANASRRPPSPFGHVTIARLARHVGVSRQSLHRIWSSQQAFVADLISYLFEARCEQVLVTMRRATRHSMEVPAGGALVATEEAVTTLVREASRGPLAHLTYASYEDDPVIRDRCRAALDSLLDRFSDDLSSLTRSWGGSTRDGVTFFHLATLIVLTELAAARLERTNPGSMRRHLPHRGGHWSALAIGMEGIVAYVLGLPIEEQPSAERPGHAL